MTIKLSPADEAEFRRILKKVCRRSRMLESARHIQHGSTSVFRHSVSVAYVTFYLARRFGIQTDAHTLVRGALLHDYFLYDWHERDDTHRWHGFIHAERALANAMEDFELNEIEQDMIRKHMFPLNRKPPRCREAWLLCLADKLCSGRETVAGIWERRKVLQRR